jgi:predicted site-specific integrase-resolvase
MPKKFNARKIFPAGCSFFCISTALYIEESFLHLHHLRCPVTAAQNHDAANAWSEEAKAMALQARVLSGDKLDQLVRRLQRHSGRSRESCWRFVLQTGLKTRDEHRRWTEDEIDTLREHVATHTVAETAKMLGRSVKSVRCALQRNDLKVREIRCDLMSIDSIAKILRVRKMEIQSWIEKGWLEATIRTNGKRASYIITPETFRALYTRHLGDLISQKRIPNVALFEAFYNYCFVPKHTIGTQLLTVRQDKRERAAYAASQTEDGESDEDDAE